MDLDKLKYNCNSQCSHLLTKNNRSKLIKHAIIDRNLNIKKHSGIVMGVLLYVSKDSKLL